MGKCLYGQRTLKSSICIFNTSYSSEVCKKDPILAINAPSSVVACAIFAENDIVVEMNAILLSNFKIVIKDMLLLLTLAGEMEVYYRME